MGGTIEAYKWAISLAKKEAAFSTQVPDVDMTKWLEIKSADFVVRTKDFRTNKGFINGTRGFTNYATKAAAGSLKRSFDFSPEVFAWLLAMQLGNLSTAGASDPYTHTLKHPSLCTLYPPSFSLVEGIVCAGLTGSQKLYKGCVVNKQELSGTEREPIEHTAEILHDGSETDKGSFSWPASVEAVSYCLNSHAAHKLNLYSAGDTDISSQVLSWKVAIDSQLKPTKSASNSIYVPRYKYGRGAPMIDIELVISADKSDAIHDFWEADPPTKLKYQLIIEPGLTPARTVTLVDAECFIQSCEPGEDDLEPTLKLKLSSLDVVANTGPAVWTAKTGLAAYLTT